ncbi:MAG: HEAT repeat domain-containing protein, partial [Caldilineaceae bacterium]|nr:HEAT repeat domain-containing protein [Caldilineaceae bacterium]
MIDWKSLALEVGAIQDGSETGSSAFAQKAIEQIIGVQNVREAVDYYIRGGPGAELARFVLWQIHSWTAMQYCYEIYQTDSDIERRRGAVELLRVVADRRVIPWLEEFLTDPDRGIRMWAFGIIDQLLWSEIVEEEEVAA